MILNDRIEERMEKQSREQSAMIKDYGAIAGKGGGERENKKKHCNQTYLGQFKIQSQMKK